METDKTQPRYYIPEAGHFPILATIGITIFVVGLGNLLNSLSASSSASFWPWVMLLGFVFLASVIFSWFRRTIIENMQGLNSSLLKKSYVLGMQWFIFSEVMFFLAFFGTLFYVRTFAGPWLGGEGGNAVANRLWDGFQYHWPLLQTPQEAVGQHGRSLAVPVENQIFTSAHKSMSFPGWGNMLQWLPLWNTIVLLSSSFTVHMAHLGIKKGNRTQLALWLGITIALGFAFVVLQAVEYYEAYAHYGLTLKAGIYGSTFFILTGFHGFHVMLGAFMLLVMWLRATTAGHFSHDDCFGFEAASWYWHFVDVVWVGLFLFVYII